MSKVYHYTFNAKLFLLHNKRVQMIHGHYFHFIDEPSLQDDHSLPPNKECKHIDVKQNNNTTIPETYSFERLWVPLSGQEGRYFAKTPFEEADESFSWGLEIKNVLILIWEPKEQNIRYIKGLHYTPQRLRFWTYHTFFPMSLEFNHIYHFLHVGAVEVQGKTLFFSAPSFGGKSTLTDYFMQQGATLISDDALGIEEQEGVYTAIPAYPYHRPYREPEELGYKVENFASKAKKVDAVFLLKKADANAKINIQEVKGIEKFKAFHHAVFIEFPFRKEERFKFFGDMVQSVPVYTVTIPWDLTRLHEVHKALIGLALPNA